MSPSHAGDDYSRDIPYAAATRRVFEALTTREGLAGWWTPLISGSPAEGGRFQLRFAGLEEKIVIHVERATAPTVVVWRCLEHSGHPDWANTTIAFRLDHDPPAGGLLRFSHSGLNPTLTCYAVCERGWDHFLASLLRYAERGRGTPFTGTRVAARS